LAALDGSGPLRAAAALFPGSLPDRGLGSGVELYLMLDTPARDGVSFSRVWQTTFLHLTNNEAGQRCAKERRIFATTAGRARGRLRLARTGPTLVASVAEGDQQVFPEVHRTDVGPADVRMIRFAGTSGGRTRNGLDMRLLEFRLDAQDLGRQGRFATAAPPVETPAAPEEVMPGPGESHIPVGGRRRWWPISGLIVVALVSVTALVIWRRAKGRMTPGPAPARTPSVTTHPASAPAVRCTHCGKGLKVKDDLAGKKVRCPGCGHSVAVPGTNLG
jgi:hypothetical protein